MRLHTDNVIETRTNLKIMRFQAQHPEADQKTKAIKQKVKRVWQEPQNIIRGQVLVLSDCCHVRCSGAWRARSEMRGLSVARRRRGPE